MTGAFRGLFPFFKNNPDVVYLDSAATSQKPKAVIDIAASWLSENVCNPARGNYALSTRAVKAIEDARAHVSDFLGLTSDDALFFTNSATDSFRWASQLIRSYDCFPSLLLCCEQDHKSLIDPWVKVSGSLLNKNNEEVLTYSVRTDGCINTEQMCDRLGGRAAICLVSQINNTYGAVNDLSAVRRAVGCDSIIVADMAQSVGHVDTRAAAQFVDILAFSAHKMFGLPGTGVLVLRKRVLELMARHSRMSLLSIVKVMRETIESASPNVPGIIGLNAAVELVGQYSLNFLSTRVTYLTRYAIRLLRKIPGIVFSSGPAYSTSMEGAGIISFFHPDVRTEDIGDYLAAENICIRTGGMCSFADSQSQVNCARLSLHAYNTDLEVETAVGMIMQAVSRSSLLADLKEDFVSLMPLDALRPHERIDPDHTRKIINKVRSLEGVPHPLLVDGTSGVILDGHHRYEAARHLGINAIPCLRVDYLNDRSVTVVSLRDDIEVTKDTIIAAGMSGSLFPPKTSRHALL
jgi:cysteine desulfurase/selenocysteine lyase